MGIPAHLLPLDPLQAGDWLATLGFASPEHRWHQKRNLAFLKELHDWHVEEGPIEQQTADFQAQFVDAVEVFYNGINIRTDPSLFTLGSAVALDDESYMDGFEGIANPAANSANGNLNLNFGSALVNTITIRYFSSDDANNNPQSQTIGLSDLLFVAIPEPAAVGFAPLLLLALGMARRRSSRS